MKLFVYAMLGVVLGIIYHLHTRPGLLAERSILSEVIAEEYDYIVVGGGSAGSVVASRLSEDEDTTVLLLEAGGFYDENPDLHIPMRLFSLQHTEHDWGYFTEPQEHCNLGMVDNKSFWPRGRVLGGTGMLNGMQYTRGSPHDFDNWAKNGCTGWSYKDVLPYFLKSEDMHINELKSSEYHNSGGPIAVTSGAKNKPLADLFMKAGVDLGYKVIDYNGADMEGFSNAQLTVRDGIRSSSSVEYLGRFGRKGNLDIAVNSLAVKVEIENNVATGVYFIKNNKKVFVKSRREIIISAGAINTPQLLMLSGVGPDKHLKEFGITVKADLPVGENLQDHSMLFMLSKINKPYGILPDIHTSLIESVKYKLFGSFPMSTSGIDGSAFFYLDEGNRGMTYPDIQFIMFDILLYQSYARTYNLKDTIAKDYLIKDETQHGFSTVISLTHPKSTGTVKLKSIDPFDYPAIDPKYLSDTRDIEDLLGGIRLWEKYIETPTMKELGADVSDMKLAFCSEHKFRSDSYWKCVIRNLLFTVYHPCGTCKMGAETDPTAVVDPQLRVKGIKGLRVVDASIFPNITTGNTNAPIIMAAEKLADMVRVKNTVKHLKVDI